MQFDDLWHQYDFTESEVVSMRWEKPLQYALHIDYYWDLSAGGGKDQVARMPQPMSITFRHCIRLDIAFTAASELLIHSPNFGTIVGWQRINPSPWVEERQLSPMNWIDVFFQIGADGYIHALCREIVVDQLLVGGYQS